MQSIEIDPELNRLALAEAAKLYPEFADMLRTSASRPLSDGFAWQLVRKGAPPGGQGAWEFQTQRSGRIRDWRARSAVNLESRLSAV
jgi:hypothetical protein